MTDEFYSFSPVDKIPINKYENKDPEYWGWMDFFRYFEDEYTKRFGHRWVTLKQRNSKKQVIEQSIKERGAVLYKAMIDWVFENYKDFPEWNEVHIGLVSGAHGYANMIAKAAQKQLELDKRWER
jgi:hypothetical protein